MDENQSLRNALMDKFNLTEEGDTVTPPPAPTSKTYVHEHVEEIPDADTTTKVAPVSDDKLYEPKGDSPTVSSMLSQVIKNSAEATDSQPVTPEERKKLAETCIDESIIRGILGDWG